jgi:tetratricopeptide (TPR) repeat protein
MSAHGRLAQILLRLQMFDDAIAHAIEGYVLACSLGQVREQVSFKIDVANALMWLKRYDDAIEAASLAGQIARGHQMVEGDLKAYGVLGRCLMLSERLDEAYTVVLSGLKAAHEIGDVYEQAVFHLDLAVINQRLGKQGRATAT